MNQTDRHCTPEELQAAIDGALDAHDARRVAGHLAACASCRTARAGLARLDGALRRMPLERTSRDFTRTVMQGVGVRAGDGVFRVFEVIASLFGLAIVGVLAYVVLSAAGVVDAGSVEASRGAAADLLEKAAGAGSGLLARAVAALAAVMPDAPSSGGMTIIFSGVAVAGTLAVADALFGRNIRRKAPAGGSGRLA